MPGIKIKNLSKLSRVISGLKKKGKKIVFTNGCFDIVHYGHIMYLEKSKAKGDILVVGLNSDSSVKKIKGSKRPLVNEKDRARIIASLESVDYVTIFNEETPLKVIRKIRPDVLVKGADWSTKRIAGADFVRRSGGRACTVKVARGRSTTNLIKKIAQIYR